MYSMICRRDRAVFIDDRFRESSSAGNRLEKFHLAAVYNAVAGFDQCFVHGHHTDAGLRDA